MQTRRYILEKKRVCSLFPMPTYTVCKKPRFFPSWLWRLFSWFLYRWLIEYIPYKTLEKIETVDVDAEDLLQKIRMDVHDIDHIWHDRARHVIVGWDHYHDLLRLEDRRAGFISGISARARLSMGHDIRVFGMQIHLVPWFDGILVMPDVNFLKKSDVK